MSPDFLASDYCYEQEMMRALERHRGEQTTVIPVILRPCDWHDAPFGNLLAAPKDGKPVTQWSDIDVAFLDVTTTIKAVARKGDSAIPTHRRLTAGDRSLVQPDVRSSNLRVAKRFSERDRDRFLYEAFEYLAKFFENSLSELSKRNAVIEGQFRRIDANRFTALAYRNGESVARCSIFLGDGSHFAGIMYSHDESASGSSFNEMMSVESDDQALYLKTLGMGRLGLGADAKLSLEGCAEA